jgi:hypothetical protein
LPDHPVEELKYLRRRLQQAYHQRDYRKRNHVHSSNGSIDLRWERREEDKIRRGSMKLLAAIERAGVRP